MKASIKYFPFLFILLLIGCSQIGAHVSMANVVYSSIENVTRLEHGIIGTVINDEVVVIPSFGNEKQAYSSHLPFVENEENEEEDELSSKKRSSTINYATSFFTSPLAQWLCCCYEKVSSRPKSFFNNASYRYLIFHVFRI